MKRERIYPPNCTVCDLNPSRFLAFREKQRVVEAEYGFRLCVPRRTQEQRDGYRRYKRDWHKRYRDAHKEERTAYLNAWHKKKRELKRLRESEAKAAKERELAAKRVAFAAKQKAVFEKYGFVLGRTPVTPEEIAGHARYVADRDRAYQVANRELHRQQDKERRRRKAGKRRHLAALNAERSANAAEERRKAKEAARLEARQEREAQAAALAEAEKTVVAGFAAERKANREAYLAAKAAKRDEGLEMRDEKQSPVPSVSPHPSSPIPHPLSDAIAADLPHHPFRGLLLEDTAPTDEEIAGDAVTSCYGDYAADDGDSAEPAAGGGNTPVDPPTTNVATGGSEEDDDDDWRKREREEKIRRVREQYGFTLGVKPVTPEEIEGKKRYIADRERENTIRNRELDLLLHGKERARKAAAKKRKATIARKKREAAAQAARAAREAEREAQRKAREETRQAARAAKHAAIEAAVAAKAERKALLRQAYATFQYKVTAYERKKAKIRRQLGLPKKKSDFTPEQRERWNTYLRESRAELDNWLVERMRKVVAKEVAKAAKARKTAETTRPKTTQRRGRPPLSDDVIAARDAQIKEREERKRLIFEQYGFTLGKKPKTPEEIEGRKRYDRDKEAETRKRNREKIRAYQKAYGTIRAARRLAEAQAKWSPEQWAEWERRQSAKECPPGSPQWLVREVVKYLAQENNLPEDAVMERIIELGGLDFLIKGAESMGVQRCTNKGTVPAAAHALALYLDPDKAEMFNREEQNVPH